jgi:hypothetical protein
MIGWAGIASAMPADDPMLPKAFGKRNPSKRLIV